ncbi:MAG: beta-lactamase family protein [Inquilinus sp.]|nr:beta-lactamase family protein [Inquilinus sp.]
MSKLLEAAADRAFAPVQAVLDDGRIPGAALGIVTADGARAVRWGGMAMLTPDRIPLERETLFDLASLTKVMVTVPEVLRLVEDGLVDLDDALARHLPELCADEPNAVARTATLRQLLTHHAGVPALEAIHLWPGDAAALKERVVRQVWPVGQKAYSDIGYILLGLLVERLRGGALADRPVGDGLTFAPDPACSAATEDCPWRGRVLRGEVHDENAFALGGAGHAGLFGTVDGVLGFAAALIEGRVLSAAALAEMRSAQTATRALGWQHRFTVSDIDEPSWAGGSLCAPGTLGHTGFTGTGLWIDFERGVTWALLTNRVHPSRHTETGIMALRRTVGNIVTAAT